MIHGFATRLRQRFRGWHVGLLYVLLFAGAATAQPLTGADVAYLVNQRYQSTVAQCAAGRPAWQCSGVLMRALSGDSAVTFGQLSAQETALQSASVAYVRRDVTTVALASSAGLILADGFTATGQGKPYEVRCAYPFAMPLATDTASHGCNLINDTQPTPPDWSSCAGLGVSDAPGWVTYFNTQGIDVVKQCSLSATIASQFKASLEAHEQVSADLADSPTMLLLAAWDPARPETIPLQAFYYDVANGGQLTQAQRYQRQYFDATGQWLPILRMAMASGVPTAFGFDERDQLDYGIALAQHLNARFADTSVCPGGVSPYLCNGVIVRVTGYGSGFHSWNPSPTADRLNGVSTTYMRADVHITAVAYGGGEGLIFAPLGAPVQTPLIARCIYPGDGATDLRADKCGIARIPRSAPCAQLGITTLATWRANYDQTGWDQQCALGVDTAAFDLSVAARTTFPMPPLPSYEWWNELVIAPWPQNIPGQIPLEAVMYTPESPTYLAGARYIQNDYFNQTGQFLPIIKIDIPGHPQAPFSYTPGDQGTAN
ncbi:hypothetical protein [Pandoraea sp. NPDC087047]|uniref:hypothetical protein n=1 Tax=Pandoraea sp. NPDC087047 TaxID=3364390 RepID=UPI0038014768